MHHSRSKMPFSIAVDIERDRERQLREEIAELVPKQYDVSGNMNFGICEIMFSKQNEVNAIFGRRMNEKRIKDKIIFDAQAEFERNHAEFWQFANFSAKGLKHPTVMHHSDKIPKDSQALVDLLAAEFESTHDFVALPHITEFEVSLDDIAVGIRSLEKKGGSGPDGISKTVMKKCSYGVVWPLWLLLREAFDAGCITHKIKLSRVVQVLKMGDKPDTANSRIIAISLVMLKIFERTIKIKLTHMIQPHLSDPQHGFRPSRSVTKNLACVSTILQDAFAKNIQMVISKNKKNKNKKNRAKTRNKEIEKL